MDNFFCFENWPKSVLKDATVYALTFHCNCCRFETVFMTIFKIRGQFSKPANFQTGIKISFPKKFKLFLLNSLFNTTNDHM